MAEAKTLELSILGREYRVNCPDGAEEELKESARALNARMNEIKSASANAGKVLSADRIAVIAALNLTHQLLSLENVQKTENSQLKQLESAIDRALDKDLQLEL